MIGVVELRDRCSHTRLFEARTLPASTNTVTLVVVLLAAAASLSPAMLPRSAWVQGIFTGILVVLALATRRGVILLAGHARRRGSGYPDGPVPRPLPAPLPTRLPARQVIAAGSVGAAGLLLVATLVAAHRWQNALRAATGMPPVGLDYWRTVTVVATALTLAVIGTRQWIRRPHRWSRVLAAPAAMVVLVVAGTALFTTSSAAADNSIAPGPTRSGSLASAVALDDLPRHGRTFVTDGPDDQIRIYVGPDSADDPSARAALAIAELDRTGAWDRPVILVAVPTGSGWVDTHALAGFTERFGPDTAVVSAAYSGLPSWLAAVVSRDEAIATTTELLAAVERRVAALPVNRRPAFLLYGQSLGAVAGAEAARRSSDTAAGGHLCAQFLVGPPVGTPITPTANVLANASDPVVVWSPRLLVAPPSPTVRRDDAPRPGWLPILGFLQTSVDLLSALDPGPGHGHRYGVDQIDGPLYCAPEPVAAPTVSAAPLATSNAAATR